MKLYEVETTETDLGLLLRNIIAQANSQNQTSYLSWSALHNLQQNVNSTRFTYDSFKEFHDNSPLIQNLVQNFDANGVELKTNKASPTASGKEVETNIERMAKNATNRRMK